jgi:hypothetical protein
MGRIMGEIYLPPFYHQKVIEGKFLAQKNFCGGGLKSGFYLEKKF